jgi:hypothetical protein
MYDPIIIKISIVDIYYLFLEVNSNLNFFIDSKWFANPLYHEFNFHVIHLFIYF